MRSTRLEDRFRAEVSASTSFTDNETLSFAVDLARLAVRALSLVAPSAAARDALIRPLRTRTGWSEPIAQVLLDMALRPEFRAAVTPAERVAFGARFGLEAVATLQAEEEDELDLAGFAVRYGASESLLLLDTLFAVAGADGAVDPIEIQRLRQAARHVGVDEVLVSALLQKHDPRHATGDIRFELSGRNVVIGRAAGCDVVLPDPQVARRHAEMVRTGSDWRVVDLNSGRPTVVNGVAVSSAPMDASSELRIGPYKLRVADDELIAFGERSFSALSVRQLSRRIRAGSGQMISLLDNVSFTVFSGEVVALVGPSGAGKTTLLNAISGVAAADDGDVLMDGQPFHRLLDIDRSLVGTVPQDDLVHPELSVEESLFYAGRLRFPMDVRDSEVRSQVDRVLTELELDGIRTQRIGSVLRRGISGGQRKRATLGQELMTRSTRVLFLDEPTSGLDPRASQDVVRMVRQLADRGRIVFLVTHDLTPEIMSQVDHMLVLAPGGRLAFFGPPQEACSWFGVHTPDAVFNRLSDRLPQEWGQHFRDGHVARKYVATREHLLGLEGLSRGTKREEVSSRRSPITQMRTLVSRYSKVKIRDTTGMIVLGLQPPLLALVMWVVFPKPTTPLLFMVALSSLWFGMSAGVRELIVDRIIWRRERRVGVSVLAYVGSKVLVLGLLVGLQCALFGGFIYAGLGLGSYGFSGPMLLGVCVLIGWVGMSLGFLVSACWTSSEAAVGTLPLLLIPQIVFSSIMVSVRSMGELGQFLTWFTVQRYAFDAVIKCGSELAYFKYGEWKRQRVRGFLYELGLKLSSDADDMGFNMWELSGILFGFTLIFLGGTVALVWLRDR